MFYALSKVLDFFLSPYAWGILLLAAATPWSRRAGKRFRRRRAYGIAGLAVFVVAGMAPIPHALMWQLEHADAPTYRADVTYDAVVLLSGLVDEVATAESGIPAYTDAVDRLIATQRLLREERARFVIVSAGTNPEFPASGEGYIIAAQLAEWGIAKDRIVIEDRSRNTRENAVYSQAIAKERGWSRVVVVTSTYHMRRAVECFAAVGMPVDTYPVDYRAHAHVGGSLADWVPRADGLDATEGTLREMFGRLVYRLRGYARREG